MGEEDERFSAGADSAGRGAFRRALHYYLHHVDSGAAVVWPGARPYQLHCEQAGGGGHGSGHVGLIPTSPLVTRSLTLNGTPTNAATLRPGPRSGELGHPGACTVNLGDFDALSFDCYGTLIDWEAGIAAVLRVWADSHGLQL